MYGVSVVTLVNNRSMYERNVVGTIGGRGVELVPVHNPISATSGLNFGIENAKNDLIVTCHQDVVFPIGWIYTLFGKIKCLGDKSFGVVGTFGIEIGTFKGVGNVKSGCRDLYSGNLPCVAMHLDEHCLVMRKSSGLRFDESLAYFHIYGADLCLAAYSKGLRCYAIDAKLHHISDNPGTDPKLDLAVEWLVNKWKGKTSFPRYRITAGGRFIDLR